MYSLVLMAAISGGPGTVGADQPGVAVAPPVVVVGCTGSCTGCTGCTGYVSSCHGCCGGFFHRHARSSACCGGTVAASCHGCCGGFLGHKHSTGCCGGYSSFGSCSGFVHQSAWGNCHGCCGGFGAGIPSTYYYPSYSTPILTGAAPFYFVGPTQGTVPPVVVPPAKDDDKKDSKKGASLKFNLPAGATLFVDGVKTPGDGAERTFFTPPLEAGQKYFYDVRAEVAIDGKTVVEEKRVIVEAGADVSESFPKMIAAVAAGSNVAGK